MARDAVHADLHHIGDEDQLALALRQVGLGLSQGYDGWVLAAVR